MNIQKLIIAALTATVLPTSLNAQQTFNEMMYSKEKTMFILNAPTAQKSSVTLRLYTCILSAEAPRRGSTHKL